MNNQKHPQHCSLFTALFLLVDSVLSHNTAVSGGAIHATESRIDVNGALVIANNKALDNGGGIYLYRSDFNCRMNSNTKIIGNCADNNSGGGIYAISSAIRSRMSEILIIKEQHCTLPIILRLLMVEVSTLPQTLNSLY